MATIQVLNNGETGLVIRNKINQNFANLNGDKLETSLFTSALQTLSDDASTWDLENDSIRKAKVNLTTNATITLSNTTVKGMYFLRVTKTVSGAITVIINQASLTSVFPGAFSNITLEGATNSTFEFYIQRYDTHLFVSCPTILSNKEDGDRTTDTSFNITKENTVFAGSSNATGTLPAGSSAIQWKKYYVANDGTALLTVNDSGATEVYTLTPSERKAFMWDGVNWVMF